MSNSAEHAVHFLRLAGQCIDGTTTKEYSVHCSVKKRDTLVQDTHMVQFLFHCFVHLNAKSLAFWAELTYQWKILDEPIVEKMLFCLKRVCVDFDKTFRAICKDTKVTRDCLQKTMVQQSLQPGGGRAGSPEVLEADAVLLVAQAGIVAQQQDMKDANGIVAAFKAFGDNPGPGDEDLLFYFIVFQMDMEERWKACEAKGIMRTEGGKANEVSGGVGKVCASRHGGSNRGSGISGFRFQQNVARNKARITQLFGDHKQMFVVADKHRPRKYCRVGNAPCRRDDQAFVFGQSQELLRSRPSGKRPQSGPPCHRTI